MRKKSLGKHKYINIRAMIAILLCMVFVVSNISVYAVEEPSEEMAVEIQEEQPAESEEVEEQEEEPAEEPSEEPSEEAVEETVEEPVKVDDPEEEKIKELKYSEDSFTVKVSCSAGFDDGTDIRVKEIKEGSSDYNAYLAESALKANLTVGISYSKVLDISLVKDGKEIEPDDSVVVTVRLNDKLSDPQVIHFEGEDETPVLMDATSKGKEITFETKSFSSYAIVTGPDPIDIGFEKVTSDDNLDGNSFYISHTLGYYFTNESFTISGTRSGVRKTALTDDPATSASKYTFESNGNGKYYIYCIGTDGNKKYLRNNGNNSLLLSDTPVTAFTVEMKNPGVFVIHNDSWYVNMQGGVNGKAFACYNNSNDANNNMNLWVYEEPSSDPYNLTGKTYGLMRYTGGSIGKAAMNTHDATSLDAQVLQVMTNENDRTDRIYVPKDSDLSMWSFEWVKDNDYYVTSDGKYLSISDGEVTMSDTPVTATVTAGEGAYEGRLKFSSGSDTLKYGGSLSAGFVSDTTLTSDSWLYLVEEAPITSDYKMTYNATKVSVSDTEAVHNGAQVIIYTREWNDRLKKYEFYAIDHDGTMVPCTDGGDSIQWKGNAVNTLLWDFTEYYYEGTTTSNQYYDFQNTYSGKYLAPQADGQVLADSPIGVNLSGRRYNDYYTPITAWDDPNYTYAALDVNDGELSSGSISKLSDFYFAIVEDVDDDEGIDTVNTIDNTQHGITMKIIDFNGNSLQNAVLGSSEGGANVPPTQGLLSTDLDNNGYPTAVNTGRSMKELFGNATEVNHLFLESIYNASGYYEYDSTQNFASLQPNKDFKVYTGLGTTDSSSKPSLKHGQFFPYDDITPGTYASVNGENLYDAVLHELPETDTRKYERLYKIMNPNYQFGLEIGASFVQTPSGLDAWGHDIIYEFTGDDDFWLYVDGELLIDLGGIHSALPGSVNYSTGEVVVNGKKTTVYDIFRNNYIKRNPTATAAEIDAYLDEIFELNEKGDYLFKDYSTHTMKIYFMERGAGASNLHMKFNLSSIRPGQVVLNKQISGNVKQDYRLAEYGYQIYYQTEEDGPYYLLEKYDSRYNITVSYQNSNSEVKFLPTYTPSGSSVSYDNVFFLTPAQTVVISVPDDTIRYKIVECGVNEQVYDAVEINDEPVTGTPAGTGRKDYTAEAASVYERPRVVFDNHVNENAERNLTITKKLFDADGELITDDPTGFSFRLYLGNENEPDPPAANTQDYHVKDPDGNYCVWNAATQSFSSTGEDNFDNLSSAQKEAATFQTSPNGSISKIPAGYKVEVRDLLVGTSFRVEERESEIPAGYSFIKYEREGTSYIISGDTVNSGIIRDNESPAIEIHNKRGFGLSMKKQWSDANFMSSHDETFFGVYAGNDLVSVKRLTQGKTSLYWYFDALEQGLQMSDYTIKEVTLSGEYEADGENVSGNYTATPIANGGTVTVGATDKEGVSDDYLYTVTYTMGTPTGAALNARTDTVTNSRHGIRLVKQDMNGNPLSGAVFTLTDPSGNKVGLDSYTSDNDGLITIAYVNVGTRYTLQENSTARGYQPVADSISFIQNADGTVSVTDGNAACTVIQGENGSMPEIRIKNRPFTLKAVKISDTGTPLGNAHFALHKEVTIGGSPTMSFDPMPGFDDVVSMPGTGVLPRIDQTLLPGTYYLRETSAPYGFGYIPQPIRFTISQTGQISSDDIDIEVTDGDTVTYKMYITNTSVLVPTGKEHILYGLSGVLLLLGVLLVVLRRRADRRV